jgi:CRISPR-associated protein Cas4
MTRLGVNSTSRPGPDNAGTLPDLIPARMLNEFAYCPRLCYLMWVQGEWADNLETEEGRYVHRKADQPEGPKAEVHTRSLHLSSESLGLTAVVDVVEREGTRVRPVEYKRGKTPLLPEGAYEPERVQLCAQGLLLRERGYECHEGLVYYAASHERVRIRFTPELEGRTLELLAQMRARLAGAAIPEPLEDSPKCPRCSLVGICLPEEVRFLTRAGTVRPIAVADPALYPFVVQEPGATIRLDHDRLVAEAKGKELASVGFERVSQVVVMGIVHVTTAALQQCLSRGVPVVFLSGAGWFYGMTRGLSHKNVELRARRFAAASDGRFSLALAKSLVAAEPSGGLRTAGRIRMRLGAFRWASCSSWRATRMQRYDSTSESWHLALTPSLCPTPSRNGAWPCRRGFSIASARSGPTWTHDKEGQGFSPGSKPWADFEGK